MMQMGEEKVLIDLREYIESTYSQHYSVGGIQTIERIMNKGWGEGFCIGNAQKYLDRYGLKNGKNEKDLMKALHYIILAVIDKRRIEPAKK